MALQPYHRLQGLSSIREVMFLNELENNFKAYLDFGLLNKGAWFDAIIPTSGLYGGDFATLRLVHDDSYTDGQVWESAKKDWVWETGVEYPSGEPIQVSGVYVDGTFKDFSASGYEYHINYPLGRVVFDSPIDTEAVVKANYSHRFVQVYKASEADWFQELQYEGFRVDDTHFSQLDTGDWSIGGQTRIQMPTIVIEAVPRSRIDPHELGNNSLTVYQDVAFHVMTDNRVDRNRLLSIIMVQTHKNIHLFNTNQIVASGDWPLDYRGMIVGDMMYPDLVDTYPYEKCRFYSSTLSQLDCVNPKLHTGSVIVTFETILRNN